MSMLERLKALFRGGAEDGAGPEAICGKTSSSLTGEAEMLPCEEVLRLVHDYLDGELEGVPESQVRKHFEMCEQCYPHLKLETVYRDAMRRVGSGGRAPAALKDRVAVLLAEADAEG